MVTWKYEITGEQFEDDYALKVQIHAWDMHSKVLDAMQKIHARLKYVDSITESETKFLEDLYDELRLEWED